MIKLLIKITEKINFLLRIIVGLSLLIMTILIGLQISVRFILPYLGFPAGMPWTEEAARYLMVWLIFLGGAIAARHGLLIAVNALIEALPNLYAKHLYRLSTVILIIVFCTMAWYGWKWALFGASEISPALKITKFWLYISMPIGCILAALNSFVLLLSNENLNDETHIT